MGSVWHRHTALNAYACRLCVWLCSVWLAYFVLCCDLAWQLTEDWEQQSCRPWSARRDTERHGDEGSYLVTPTLPSPVTGGLPYCLLPFFTTPWQRAAIHTKTKLFAVSFSYLLARVPNFKSDFVCHGKHVRDNAGLLMGPLPVERRSSLITGSQYFSAVSLTSNILPQVAEIFCSVRPENDQFHDTASWKIYTVFSILAQRG